MLRKPFYLKAVTEKGDVVFKVRDYLFSNEVASIKYSDSVAITQTQMEQILKGRVVRNLNSDFKESLCEHCFHNIGGIPNCPKLYACKNYGICSCDIKSDGFNYLHFNKNFAVQDYNINDEGTEDLISYGTDDDTITYTGLRIGQILGEFFAIFVGILKLCGNIEEISIYSNYGLYSCKEFHDCCVEQTDDFGIKTKKYQKELNDVAVTMIETLSNSDSEASAWTTKVTFKPDCLNLGKDVKRVLISLFERTAYVESPNEFSDSDI